MLLFEDLHVLVFMTKGELRLWSRLVTGLGFIGSIVVCAHQVYKAEWRGMAVVVKVLKHHSSAVDDMLFQNEISVMSTLRQ